MTRLKDRADARAAALEKRLQALEERVTLDYKGVWDASKQYNAGHLVTRNGSMWVSRLNRNKTMPGADSNHAPTGSDSRQMGLGLQPVS